MVSPDLAAPTAAIRSPRSALRVPRIGFLLSTGWLIALFIAAVAFVLGAGADPLANDYAALSQPPSWAHLFGTDNLGRDVLARSLHGAGASATVALATVVVGGGIGILLGVWAGLMRGVVETIIGFFTDVAIALPGLIVISTIVTLTGPSLPTIALTIAGFSIPVFARLSRASTLAVATENHVVVARTLGASGWRIVTREVLPSVLPRMTPFLMISVAGSIVAEGALSFLGFGLRPPQPSWGSLIADGRAQLADAPWVALFPALLLCLTILSINVLGEHFREAKR
ncbi:ABC-type dipeptide/oligopeptide/nickel transport system permease subunit [Microbacterium natoriense]|uniref:ABC-type dipeptide/oligopeptide/nickel transport system permease subunit n=1 Tax=Microbacterium natoriense TaxID=284570 RepID=A0AAW8EUV7_9MICO|nr:ABC transporter permease [Microbacterium natoriense]MDQ0647043.1 ABC-type dipeptide/oligopeptide/nickel transport system permease subunit [Microbacterium natoriense]